MAGQGACRPGDGRPNYMSVKILQCLHVCWREGTGLLGDDSVSDGNKERQITRNDVVGLWRVEVKCGGSTICSRGREGMEAQTQDSGDPVTGGRRWWVAGFIDFSSRQPALLVAL